MEELVESTALKQYKEGLEVVVETQEVVVAGGGGAGGKVGV